MDKSDKTCYNSPVTQPKTEVLQKMNDIVYVGKHSLTKFVSRHSHKSWELIYCTSGEGKLVFEDEILEYHSGEIVIIPPLTPHYNSSDSGFTNYHVNVMNATLAFSRPTLISGNEYMLNAFAAAFYHFSDKLEGRQMILSSYGNLICAYMYAYREVKHHSGMVEEIENHIISNYTDASFDLEAYLKSFPFSYDYLRKVFKKEVGETPHKFLNDKRLQAAADRLSTSYSGDNISEISQLCGFSEPLYFSRMFKKKYGVAPSRFASSTAANGEDVKIMLEEDA